MINPATIFDKTIETNKKMYFSVKKALSGNILETEGSARKIQKRALFYYKKVKKGTLI